MAEKLTFRALRLAREITQDEMAKMLGVHVNTYIEWEKNPKKITLDFAYKICEILNVNIDDVIFLPEHSTKM